MPVGKRHTVKHHYYWEAPEVTEGTCEGCIRQSYTSACPKAIRCGIDDTILVTRKEYLADLTQRTLERLEGKHNG